VKNSRSFRANYPGVGPIEMSFEFRSPNGFISYLGEWHNFGDKVSSPHYVSIAATRIINNGPYLSIANTVDSNCYASIPYEDKTYCVPTDATHTTMLMDMAIILRNLNVQPTDLNAPLTVRLAE
jgi:hypothetical protein